MIKRAPQVRQLDSELIKELSEKPGSYARRAQALNAMRENPNTDRRAAVEELITAAGGKLIAMYGRATNGPGAMGIFDVPDPAMAPAMVGVTVSSGSVQNVELTRLFTMEEIAGIRQKARQIQGARSAVIGEGGSRLPSPIYRRRTGFCVGRWPLIVSVCGDTKASDRPDFREVGPWAAAGERQDEASFRSKWGARADLAVEPARATGGRPGEPGYRKTVEAKELTIPQTPAQSASDRSNVTIKVEPGFG